MAGHIASAGSVEWCTPAWLVELVRNAFRGEIDLDPCSNAQSAVGAKREIRLAPGSDGLLEPWIGRTYANPPFGRVHVDRVTKEIVSEKTWKTLGKSHRGFFETTTIARWVKKARGEHETLGAEVQMLLPAAVDTRHWHEHVWRVAARVCFLKGRIQFDGVAGSKGWCAPMACAVVYWGHRAHAFETAFMGHGRVITP